MNIYLFDGTKINTVNSILLIGKTFFARNIFRIETATELISGGVVPEIIQFKIGKGTTCDRLEMIYEHSGWTTGGDPEYADLDDFYEYTEMRSKSLDEEDAQKLLFCVKENDVKKYSIFNAIDSGFKPNRALVEVKLLGVDIPLNYATTDLSLKAGDKVIVTGGRYAQYRGTITTVKGTYLEYFGQNNLMIALKFYEYYRLQYVEKNTNDAMFALQENLTREPIDPKHIPSDRCIMINTKKYLTVTFKHNGIDEKFVIVCTVEESKVKKAILRLTKAYKSQNKEYNDIRRVCAFHRGISFNSLPQFVIYVITSYYNLGWENDVSLSSIEVDY